jgi:hypothetical protein
MWDDCVHEWEERDSICSNEYYTFVRCVKCGCPGELEIETNEVYWPAT